MKNHVIIQAEEYYELLQTYDKDFVDTILSIHTSYTNQKETDDGCFDFIYDLVCDIINGKIIDDHKIKFTTNCTNFDMAIISFSDITKIITKMYNGIHKDMDLLKSMILNIDTVNVQLLQKHNLITHL